jgi:outer membrane protein assembly factor BamB
MAVTARHIARGDWPMYRRDERLSAHSPLGGAPGAPRLAWRHALGGAHDFVVVDRVTGAGEAELLVVAGGCVICWSWRGERRWKSPALGVVDVVGVADLDADGRREVVAIDATRVLVLGGDDGRLVWQDDLGPPVGAGISAASVRVAPFYPGGRGEQIVAMTQFSRDGRAYDFSDGAERGRLLFPIHVDDHYHPGVAIVDTDGDGRLEIAVTKFGSVYLLSPIDGALLSEVHWRTGEKHGRNYGLFQWSDIEGDGELEAVVISNAVTKHAAAVDNERGHLRLLWDTFYEHIYPSDVKDVRFCPSSVADLDGDRRQELVFSLFNDEGDDRWHLIALDAATGERKGDWPDRYLWGLADADGDGRPEIFASVERRRTPAAHARVEVGRFRGGAFAAHWGEDDASFEIDRHHAYSLEATAQGYTPREQVIVADFAGQGRSEFLVTSAADGSTRICRLVAGGEVLEIGRLTPLPPGVGGRVVAARDVDGDGQAEAIVARDDGRLWVCSGDRAVRAEIVSGAFEGAAPIAYRSAPGMPAVVVAPDGGGQIVAVALERRGHEIAPVARWRHPGRGRRAYGAASALAADFDGDGQPEVVFGEQASDRSWRLVAVDEAGRTVWEHAFDDFTARVPGGLYDWAVGHFGPAGELAVFAALYRSQSMNSEESMVVRAADHRVLWHRAAIGEGEGGRGFGPTGVATVRRRADGADDLLFLAKDIYCDVAGASGQTRVEPFYLSPISEAARERLNRPGVTSFTAYGSAILADLDGDGADEALLGGCYGGLGALRADGTPLWWLPLEHNDVHGLLPGIADVDGDGLPELGVGHRNGVFRCYAGPDARIKWERELQTTASDVATGDVDGDGRAEFIFGTADGRLLALGGEGASLWSHDFGYRVGSPILCDVAGDGGMSIVVPVGDGHLYGLSFA